LRIREREPVALVQMGELYYVDRQGRLFKPLSPGDPHDFPVITGLGREHFLLSEGALPEVLAKVFELLQLLKSAAPPLNLENIAEVHVDLERGFTLYANGLGSAVDLGLADFPEKLSKFARVWPILTQKGYLSRVERINLDYPQKVLLSQKGGDEKSLKP
jgi:cell division protein FtsQ